LANNFYLSGGTCLVEVATDIVVEAANRALLCKARVGAGQFNSQRMTVAGDK
jgi:hypothetical protein